MSNEEKILEILTTMQSDVSDLKHGQAKLEEGQVKLEVRLDRLEEGQARLENRQANLEDGQAMLENQQSILDTRQNRMGDVLLEMQSNMKTLVRKSEYTNQVLNDLSDEQKTIKTAVLRLENEDIPAINKRLTAIEVTHIPEISEKLAIIEGNHLPAINKKLAKIEVEHIPAIHARLDDLEALARSTNQAVAVLEGVDVPNIKYLIDEATDSIERGKRTDMRVTSVEDRLDKHEMEHFIQNSQLAV